MLSDIAVSVRDPERLRALRKLAVLDTGAEEAFDSLTRLVTRLLHVPVALVSLVDEDRQFFKSLVGLPEPWASRRQTPLSYSFCQHVVHQGQPVVISDAREDPLVRDNLAVTEFNVAAYAGIPLATADGMVLGTLCAIDGQPRPWSQEDLAVLTDLAAAATTELELRAAAQEIARRAERLARLQAVTASLSRALTPEQVANAVLQQGLPAMNAKAGTVAVLDNSGEHLELIAHLGYDPRHVEPFQRFSVDEPVPLADAVRTEEPVFLESPQMWETYYPGVETHLASGGQAAAAVPLIADESVLGALGLSFADSRGFPEEDRSYMEGLAAQCAQALDRARLYAATLNAQAEAEEAREQLEFILDVNTTLAGASDYQTALRSLAELLASTLADGCAIDILEDAAIVRRMVVVSIDQDDQSGIEQALYRSPPQLGSDHPVARVLATGRPMFGPLYEKDLAAVAQSREHFELLKKLGLTSYISVPLEARGRTFGVLSLLSCSERHAFDEQELALVQHLARRTAVVVDNARLYDVLRNSSGARPPI